VKCKASIIRLTHFSTIIHVSGFYIQPESTQNTQDPKSGYTPNPDLIQKIRLGPESHSVPSTRVCLTSVLTIRGTTI
jgi:hypothetical protein